MPARFRHAFTAAVITLVCAASALYPPLCPAQTSPPIPVEEWLRGPDRRDFPWKVRLLRPQLTFQQRYLLQVRADLHVDVLQTGSEQRDLHFLVKVADERGRWFHGGEYTHYTVPPKLDGGNEIQFTSGLYLRSGKYVIAVIVYD